MHERECKGYISFNRGVNELNRGVNELNRGVNELNRGVNHSVARQGCNLLRAAVTSAVTSQGCCCGNLQIHPLDLGQIVIQKEVLSCFADPENIYAPTHRCIATCERVPREMYVLLAGRHEEYE